MNKGWLVGFLALNACAHALPPTMVPAEIVRYETQDEWAAEIRHYPGDGPPVLLVHGMGANHYNFDYREEVSLAWYLQERGWDVWVPELRGDPGSYPPSKGALGGFNFDDHAKDDMPAIVDTVLAATGEKQLYWVGHSMGGMLLYTAMRDYPEKITAGVAICSPATLQHLGGLHKMIRGSGWAVGGRGRFHAQAMAKMVAPLGKTNPVFTQLANLENMDGPMVKGMARTSLIDLTKPTAQQVVQWLKAGEVVEENGDAWIAPSDVPILVIGAEKDRVAAEPNVAYACSVFTNCEYVKLSRANGFSYDYGHIDPVVGRTASSEVFPLVAEFLKRQLPEKSTSDLPSADALP